MFIDKSSCLMNDQSKFIENASTIREPALFFQEESDVVMFNDSANDSANAAKDELLEHLEMKNIVLWIDQREGYYRSQIVVRCKKKRQRLIREMTDGFELSE